MENQGDFNCKKALSGAIQVFDADGTIAAVFDGEAGSLAFSIFKNGLVTYGKYSLYNLDAGQFEVGDVAQLASA